MSVPTEVSASPIDDAVPPAPATLNLALVMGTLSAAPVLRELPSGDIVADLSVTTHPRQRRSGSGPRVSVPVAWRDPGKLVHRLKADQQVVVVGHVARRFFRSGGRLASRTEVVASAVHLSTQKASCRRAIAQVETAIAEVVADVLS